MFFQVEKLREIDQLLDEILVKILHFEKHYKELLSKVHPNYKESAKNLIHYLAVRSLNSDLLQNKLSKAGLPNSTNSIANILNSIYSLKTIVSSLLSNNGVQLQNKIINQSEANSLLADHTNALFGKPPKKRSTRIMVTQPTLASEDQSLVKGLLDNGMNSARINCAHDDELIWKKIIENIQSLSSDCKIMMDLGGPKLRTGKMKPGPKVIHVKPKKNVFGQFLRPAKVWLAPYGILPANTSEVDAVIPVNKKWLQKTKKGSYIILRDTRDKKCRINIEEKEGVGRWATCSDSTFVTTGTLLNVFLEKKMYSEIHTVHELLPLEEVIYLFEGDYLRIDKNPILGEPALKDKEGNVLEMAHISCSLPEIFNYVKQGENIFFDDGKIEGVIDKINDSCLIVKITQTKKNGGKLKAEKGINLPESKIQVRGLTHKDKIDLKFISKYADVVNFSFVNNKEDVDDLFAELKHLEAHLGIILKIETKEAFKNLPSILLKAMESYPIGVMMARGDLAIEIGWKHIAVIQEEIIRICEAAHIPNIWATQVLDNLAKKGVPTRSEITDAGMAQRTECVMLNKGFYINKAIRMLDKILQEMQLIQGKKKALIPKLEFNPLV